MKKLLFFSISAIFLALALTSCEDSSSASNDADILHLNTIQSQVGYTWFYEEANIYEPIPEVINQIQQTFDTDHYFFLVYSQPSCSCELKQLAFPHFMKTIIDANIPESNYTIFSMQNENTKHPHENIINITNLPEFYVLRDTVVIMDVQKAMLEYMIAHPDDSITYEELILDAISE